jgi:GTP-binding protein HflX
MWTHLERQKGGIGMRGPGETQIETDRRIIQQKISLLKKKLEKIDVQMTTQRSNRGKLPCCARGIYERGEEHPAELIV